MEKKNKILVCGADGQLGLVFQEISKNYPNFDFLFTDVNDLNICSSSDVADYFSEHQPNYLINCAAYTAVDQAEEEQAKAHQINAEGVRQLAAACEQNNTYFIHFSTDYVYGGEQSRAYLETDDTSSLNIYGDTKLDGEEYLQRSTCSSIIMRISWLYSIYGKNFVKTIHHYSLLKEVLEVVNDQIGTPTYANDLASTVMELISDQKLPEQKEIYNYSNEGVASWYDFAQAITEFTPTTCKVLPVDSGKYNYAAKRPAFSLMNKRKIQDLLNEPIPYWRESLKKCVTLLNEQQ